MFWSEEDIQPAVNMAVELFGVCGRMSNEQITVKNVVITSNKFGHLWYGDIDSSIELINEKCNIIAKRFDVKVSVFNMR